MTKGNDIREFIIDWIKTEGPVGCSSQEFHEAFYEKFGGKRQETFYGAQMVYKAQRWLEKMRKEGFLHRHRFSRGEEGYDGFPKWQYVYGIKHY